MADYLNIAGRVRTTAADGVVAEAQEIKDLLKNKSQQEINADVDNELGDRYTKEETYSKEQLDDLITTPYVNYVSVVATDATTAVTDVIPATGEANTIYRVGNWNGTQYDPTMYALFAWNGSAYVCLAVRSFVGEVYDISANHPDGQGNPTPYADLSAALGTGGANIPADIRRGGMSIQFIQGTVQSSDNKYVQYRLTKNSFSTSPSDWIDDTNKVVNDTFYVTDSKGYVIAKIYSGGVNSVDFKINGVSVNDLIASAVGIEEERAKAAEDSKLNRVIDSNSVCVTDANGYIVFKIDNAGAHAPNIFEGTINDNKVVISDKNGYIVTKIDRNGVHSAKDKYAVACMVLSESYYPTAAPTRDSDGNVTYAQVMFETGIAGSISITYTNGNSSSVAVVYGDYNYTITINRDANGNVETVNVQ